MQPEWAWATSMRSAMDEDTEQISARLGDPWMFPTPHWPFGRRHDTAYTHCIAGGRGSKRRQRSVVRANDG